MKRAWVWLAMVVAIAALAGLASSPGLALAPVPQRIHECMGLPMGPASRALPERIKVIPPALRVGPRLNVPRRGEVLLRIIDDGGVALADTTCEIWRVRTRKPIVLGLAAPSTAEPLAEFEMPVDPDTRVLCKTDNAGFVRLPFGPHPADAPRWSSFLFPIARGYELAGDPARTIAAISRAWRAPHRGGIDVVLRKLSPAIFTVQSIEGKPLPDVNVIALPMPNIVDGVETRVYAGAGYAAARAGRRLRSEVIDGACATLDLLSVMHGVGASASKPTTLTHVGDARLPSLLVLPALFRGVTDAHGVAAFAGLPSGRYAVLVAATGFETSVVPVEVGASPVQWRVVLAAIAAAPLQLVVAWCGNAAQFAGVRYKVSLLPCGCHGLVDGTLDGAALTWHVDPAGESRAEINFANLPVGCWIAYVALIDANGAYWRREDGELAASSRRFGKADAPQDIEIDVGPGALGYWKPSLMCRGEPAEGTLWFYRPVGEPEWTATRCPVNPDTGRELPIPLLPGDYECLVGTRFASPFTIDRGATVIDRFEIPLRTVRFTVGGDLRQLLDSMLDKPAPITLVIAPETSPQLLSTLGVIAQPCVRETFYRALKDIADSERLVPVEGVEMELPSGIYRWTLQSTIYLEGLIDLRGRTRASVEFSLANLPGLAIGRLSLEGIADGDDWQVEFADLAQLIENMGSRYFGDGAWYEPALTPSAVPVGDGKFLLFAPPGKHYLRINCQDRCYWRVVNVPGDEKITVPAPEDAYVSFLNAPGGGRYIAMAIGPDGLMIPLLQHGETGHPMPPGEYDLTIVDSQHTQVGATEWRPAIARSKLVVVDEATFDLAALKFEPFGSLIVRTTGRCPAEGGVDWWWLGWWLDGASQGSVAIEALDGVYWRRAYGALVMAATRPTPALESARVYLPPGRYVVRPWANAPKDACTTVDVLAGKTQTVVFSGR